jgi:type 2 lantibiotic biosynthesis protein LanM
MSSREQLLPEACAVGDRLEALALRGEDDATWSGLTPVKEHHWIRVPLKLDLYDGIPGVALFLAYLGDITREGRYTELAQAAMSRMQRQIELSRSSIKQIGGFSGWGGVIYTLTHLGVLWNESDLLSEAEALVELLPPLIKQDEQLDIIGGAAGCIVSLISLYQLAPSDRTLAAALQCGERLLAQAQSMERGVGWVTRIAGRRPLTGFSHGSAGIAWALLELAALTGEKRFRAAAIAAIDYERSLFSPKAGNWLDLRELKPSRNSADNGHDSFMTAWCHGAPGIGLARLRSLQHFDDMRLYEEIDIAIKTTLVKGFGFNHSLCHGDLGNLELLVQASQVLNNPQLQVEVERIITTILESISKHGWQCGVPLENEIPGLMCGLTGIGYGLLRLAEPKCVPSVLVLAPPTLHD